MADRGFNLSRISQGGLPNPLEGDMQIVGIEQHTDDDKGRVHTIDIWYSRRRQAWVVERLSADGSQIGAAHQCANEADAAACLEDWMRVHEDVHLVAPRDATAAEKRILSGHPRSRAA